ncbi:glycosyltransferase family 2 protein [Methylomonas sp. LW13]|uniref:glycosyltransferase family 2 protein n=1 Tax=unclassified Methylomonas TaxID=2608980 RepID=UPI00068C7FAA|nr:MULTISPECIES: glycosyltransferase family 2 protein [unclassified Methylomonas]PKD41624.1 glycosyltransferase family 2 protein [Methylomonas sp. Kb3]QBC26481.1 glycosyltransferase family 2 protein [Methylomonas sp. LW13]
MSCLVTVIIPTHNRPDLLDEAISSVVNQTLADCEIIVVDDCSTPPVNPAQIQEKFGTKIKVLRHPASLGGATAKNTGIKAASGKYIAFLDDDDLYAPTYLEKAVSTLENHPEINTLFMSVAWFGPNSKWTHESYTDAMNKILADLAGTQVTETLLEFDADRLFKALLKRVPMAFQRPVATREQVRQIGLYQEDCLLWDCDWALRAALNGRCGLVTEGLYLQRSAGQGYSSQPRRRMDHSLSNLEIKKQLIKRNVRPDLAKLIRLNYIQSAQDLSWEYINQNQGLLAVKTMLASFQYGIHFLQIKFLAHALYSCGLSLFSKIRR